MRLSFVFAIGWVGLLGIRLASAEIITCPNDFSPAYKDCIVLLDPLHRPQPAQKCDRSDCRPGKKTTIDAHGRKVCIFTCFRKFEQ